MLTWIGIGAFGSVWGWLLVQVGAGSARSGTRTAALAAAAVAPVLALPDAAGPAAAAVFVAMLVASAALHGGFRAWLHTRRRAEGGRA